MVDKMSKQPYTNQRKQAKILQVVYATKYFLFLKNAVWITTHPIWM